MSDEKIKVTGINCLYNASLVEIPYSEKDNYEVGEGVIFRDGEEKEEYGVISYVNTVSRDEEQVLKTSKILRKATANDIQKVERHMAEGEHALGICKKCVGKHGLVMSPFWGGQSFDGNRMYFMFTAEERVDFRELVKDLAKLLQKQIHLRQVGPRDKAKVIDGYGKCGRKLCCSSFMNTLSSINMEMVRAQSLESKGSSKLSGACGKLLCCLKYEVEQYKEMRKGLPTIGSLIKLKKSSAFPGEEARVLGLDILNQKIKVLVKNEEYAIILATDVEKIIKAAIERTEESYKEEGDNISNS